MGWWSQQGHGVRLAWGPAGAAALAGRQDVVVVVDVLSFTTAVDVAVGRGTAVVPAAFGRGAGGDAVVAVGRGEVTAEQPWSLSPAALLRAPAPARLVLPSPNGSAVAAAAPGTVVAACLRNAAAVGRWLADEGRGTPDRPVLVVPAGERWPDGSLRPALEDELGAGAVLDALLDASPGATASPEAEAVRALHRATAQAVPDLVRGCSSGLELQQRGFGEDVEVAVQVDASRVVPVLRDGAFLPA